MDLVLRHLGGELRTVPVEQWTDDGTLWVRWGLAGTYAVRLFPTKDDVPPGTLYKTKASRVPLPWCAADVEAARELWRELTGLKLGPLVWVKHWENGKLLYAREARETKGEVGQGRLATSKK